MCSEGRRWQTFGHPNDFICNSFLLSNDVQDMGHQRFWGLVLFVLTIQKYHSLSCLSALSTLLHCFCYGFREVLMSAAIMKKDLHKRWWGLTGALFDKSWELPFVRTCGHCVIRQKPPTTAILMLHNFCHKTSTILWLNLLWLITHSKNRGSIPSSILSTPSIGTLMPEPFNLLLTWATCVTQSLHSLRLSTSVSSLLSSSIAES